MPSGSRLRFIAALAFVGTSSLWAAAHSSSGGPHTTFAAQPPVMPTAGDGELAWIDLLPPEGFAGWEMIAAEGQTPDAMSWRRIDGELHCSGKPVGYLRTAEAFDEFILEFEWKYPADAPGNSGVLVHIDGPDKVWPKCVQVQMLSDSAGRMFPMHGADAGDSAPSETLAAAAGAWNHWRLEAIGDHITLKVRRKEEWVEANTVIVRSPTKGHIGLQSEDSPVVFRKLRLAVPPKTEVKPEPKPDGDVKPEGEAKPVPPPSLAD
ncbi:MAG TPA: DUF1080 domain-containing protein [Pirellulales bacterium]